MGVASVWVLPRFYEVAGRLRKRGRRGISSLSGVIVELLCSEVATVVFDYRIEILGIPGVMKTPVDLSPIVDAYDAKLTIVVRLADPVVGLERALQLLDNLVVRHAGIVSPFGTVCKAPLTEGL
jgi:hypothetical protein